MDIAKVDQGWVGSEDGDLVTVGHVLKVCWKFRKVVLAGMLAGAVAASVLAQFIHKEYDAIVVLSPVKQQVGGSGLGSSASGGGSQLSEMASSLAGLSLSSGSSARSEILATLQSATLTEEFIKQNNLLPVMFWKLWDPVAGKWKTSDPLKLPTLWKANQAFKKSIRTVTDSSKTGLVTMTITWTDPNVAVAWANGLVKLTNDYLRQKAIDESERNIAFLNGELAKTNVVEVRMSLYSLMENEINKEMLARGSEEYALKVIDRAMPPERPSYPNGELFTLAGAALGLFMGVAAALTLNARARQRSMGVSGR